MCIEDAARPESIPFRGRWLRLRELHADDRSRVEALLAQVAPDDLRMRFFGALRQVPPGVIDQLMRIDPAQRITVAAVRQGLTCTEADGEILAVARAHRTAGDAAEVALLVRSDLKGLRLGTLLLGRLIARCRERGLSLLEAEVMRGNGRMLRLAQKYGFRCEAVQDHICQLALDLRSPGPVAG